MASNTFCATSAAVTLLWVTALSVMAWPMRWLRVAGAASPSGRLRWLWLMPVGTKKGHSTLALIWSVTSARSWYRVSLSATTACLLTLYTPILGAFSRPAMLAVLTMWPVQAGSLAAASSIMGVNTRTPWTTPMTLTPSTHSQSLAEFSHT